jgi:hypothetical protein
MYHVVLNAMQWVLHHDHMTVADIQELMSYVYGNYAVSYAFMQLKDERLILLTSWFILVLPNITILIDQLVCMVLHKAKPVI